MKRLGMILTACLLVLGLAQCTKKGPQEQKVFVTFNATNTTAGNTRTDIDDMGRVAFNNGDLLHVYGSTKGYLGTLEYNSSHYFAGELTQWNSNDDLRFFYIGSANTPASDGTVTVNFADQSYPGEQSTANDLANIAAHFHVSRYVETAVPASTTEFEGRLRNMMAIGKFNTSAFTDAVTSNVKMYAAMGFKNRIRISSTGELTYDAAGVGSLENQSGWIVTGPARSERFVALLPADEATPVTVGLMFTSQGYRSTSANARTIVPNGYLREEGNAAIAVAAEAIGSSEFVDLDVVQRLAPDNKVYEDAVFSVANGKVVKFAKGNLVCDQGRFKMRSTQVGWPASGEVTEDMAVDGTFEHFGWGTSGKPGSNANLTMPQAYSLPETGYYYGTPGYTIGAGGAQVQVAPDLSISTDFDWGVYQFGMNTGTSWRTLTSAEWQWLLGPATGANPDPSQGEQNCRGVAYRFMKAEILLNLENYPAFRDGIVIFPDDFNESRIPGTYTLNSYSSEFQTVGEELWTTLEAEGCVFLPVQGFRTPAANDLATSATVSNVGTTGYYWTATASGSENAHILGFIASEMQYNYTSNRNLGCSVRLVQDVNLNP